MMTDTSTEAVERLARELDEPSNTLRALAAERDKWHAGWMEAEAKVSELEAERDALKALLDSVDDLSSALEQYNVKYNALAEENDTLKAEVGRLRESFRVNMIRFSPDVSHADIDDLLAHATPKPPSPPRPSQG